MNYYSHQVALCLFVLMSLCAFVQSGKNKKTADLPEEQVSWLGSGLGFAQTTGKGVLSLLMLYYAIKETGFTAHEFVTYLWGKFTGVKEESHRDVYDHLKELNKRLDKEVAIAQEEAKLEAMTTETEKPDVIQLIQENWFVLVTVVVMISVCLCLYAALKYLSNKPQVRSRKKQRWNKHKKKH